MACECQSVFNGLSKADRLKLRGAALTKAVTGFVRDDTEKHPARYPFYAAYLVVVTTPLPFPFASTLLLGTTALWARYGKSGHAQDLNGRLKEAFRESALVCNHKDFLEYGAGNAEDAGPAKVKNGALFVHTTREAFSHGWQATKHAYNALERTAFRISPE